MNTAAKKVLVIGSNATRIETKGGSGATGQYLNETVVPAMIVLDAGYEVVLATDLHVGAGRSVCGVGRR